MLRIIIVFALQLVLASAACAETLTELVTSGRVAIADVRGTGSSSGTSLRGALVNQTGSSIEIDVTLLDPLYLRNSGLGQNMVATQVYEANGSYYEDGSRRFIRLGPNERLPVMMVAYCADFERSNPSTSESFVVAAMPVGISEIARRIAAYEAAWPNGNMVVPVQVALWLAQGVKATEIQQQFSFTPEQLREAHAILQ